MRVLLDTNIIIIHREVAKIYNNDIGILFNWLNSINTTKCIHPLTVEELNRYKNEEAKKPLT